MTWTTRRRTPKSVSFSWKPLFHQTTYQLMWCIQDAARHANISSLDKRLVWIWNLWTSNERICSISRFCYEFNRLSVDISKWSIAYDVVKGNYRSIIIFLTETLQLGHSGDALKTADISEKRVKTGNAWQAESTETWWFAGTEGLALYAGFADKNLRACWH